MLICHYHSYQFDLSQPLPVGLVYQPTATATSAWYCPPVRISPATIGDWVGSTAAGASVNFNNITFNPHGNGTHTESVGHIVTDAPHLPQIYTQFHHLAQLITINPIILPNGDKVISAEQLQAAYDANFPSSALLVRTLPNEDFYKKNKNYSHSNPAYLLPEAMQWVVEKNIQHFLIDLPSVDREEDGGELAAHKIFWDYPSLSRQNCTITELFYAPEQIKDGNYLLNLQIAPFMNDACPSFPVLYAIKS